METESRDAARVADREVRHSLHTIGTLLQAADGHDGVPPETRVCLDRMAVQVRELAEAYRRLAQVAAPTPGGLVATTLRVGAESAESALHPTADHEAELRSLTHQERRILQLIAEGCTNRQIAREMFLAEKTVKNYVSNLLRKLGMERRTQAAVYATRLDRALLKYRSTERLPA